jgi:hypothetical protein
MAKKKGKRNNVFQKAVLLTKDISISYRPGLQALEGKYSSYVTAENTTLLEGSVDIDSTLIDQYPEENRWDYAIGYEGKAYFVEIHPAAATKDVDTMLKKVIWLKNWLKEAAPELKKISAGEVYYWIPSGNCHMKSGTREQRKLSQVGIRLMHKPFQLPVKIT